MGLTRFDGHPSSGGAHTVKGPQGRCRGAALSDPGAQTAQGAVAGGVCSARRHGWTKWDERARLACVEWLRERERELAAIQVMLESPGGIVLVEGRAGIGKTSLVEAAC